jgi:N-acyl amino acid synthase of PEP-CTERM/exosortase system
MLPTVPANGLATTIDSQSGESPRQPARDSGLAEGFRQYFEVVPATNDKLRRHCYRIRHEVYCQELGYEPPRADGLEYDDQDAHAIHFLVRATLSQSFVGCARLIRPNPDDPAAPLPFERTCAASLNPEALDLTRLDRARIAEVSRLAIVSQYRRRQGDGVGPISVNTTGLGGGRARLPYLTMGLYLALAALARRHGLDTLFLLTEPSLARSLGRLGVELRIIGSPVAHRGERIPYVMDVAHIIAGLNPAVRELYDSIGRDIDEASQASY